jgi:hypothetical protein
LDIRNFDVPPFLFSTTNFNWIILLKALTI